MNDQAIQWQRCISTISPVLERMGSLNTLEHALRLGIVTVGNAFRPLIQDLHILTCLEELAAWLKQRNLEKFG